MTDKLVGRLTTHNDDCALYLRPDNGSCDCFVGDVGADAAAALMKQAPLIERQNERIDGLQKVATERYDELQRQARELAEALENEQTYIIWRREIDAELKQARALQARLERLRGALERYAWHDDDCDAIYPAGELRYPVVECSCGYSKALEDDQLHWRKT